jgi:IclR family transcriptional regulator, acetate operon repressor
MTVRPGGEHTEQQGDNRYRVQAADRALTLLRCFEQEPRQRSLAELADTIGVPRPSAFRLLSTLEQHGFVRRIGQTYALGHRCLVLGSVYQADLGVEVVALPVLERLRDETGETTQLAVLEDWQVVYLARVLSHQPVAYMRSRAGAVLPAYCTGLGKALLATREPDEVAAWARRQAFPRQTPNTLTTADTLLDDLAVTRERGYAIDDEEREVGVRCVAAPVYDGSGEAIAAISVAGPPGRLPLDLGEVAGQVTACAAELSERMGWLTPA